MSHTRVFDTLRGLVVCPDHFKPYAIRLTSKLGLEEWRICVYEVDAPTSDTADDADAEFNGTCSLNAPYRSAIIHVRRGLYEEDLFQFVLTLLHEFLHMVFGDIDNTVENRIIKLISNARMQPHADSLYNDSLESTVVRLSYVMLPLIFPELNEQGKLIESA